MSEVEGKVETTGQMVTCSACGKEYYYKADKCPHCGKRSARDISAQKKYFLIMGIIIAIAIIIGVIVLRGVFGAVSYGGSGSSALDADIARSANALRGYGVDPDALEPGWQGGGGTTSAKPATPKAVSRTEGDFEVSTYSRST